MTLIREQLFCILVSLFDTNPNSGLGCCYTHPVHIQICTYTHIMHCATRTKINETPVQKTRWWVKIRRSMYVRHNVEVESGGLFCPISGCIQVSVGMLLVGLLLMVPGPCSDMSVSQTDTHNTCSRVYTCWLVPFASLYQLVSSPSLPFFLVFVSLTVLGSNVGIMNHLLTELPVLIYPILTLFPLFLSSPLLLSTLSSSFLPSLHSFLPLLPPSPPSLPLHYRADGDSGHVGYLPPLQPNHQKPSITKGIYTLMCTISETYE